MKWTHDDSSTGKRTQQAKFQTGRNTPKVSRLQAAHSKISESPLAARDTTELNQMETKITDSHSGCGKSIEYRYGETLIHNIDFEHVIKEYKRHQSHQRSGNTHNNSNESSGSGDQQAWSTVYDNDPKHYLRVYRQPNQNIFTFKAYMTFENTESELIYDLACDLTIRKYWDPIYIQVKQIEQLSSVTSENENTTITSDIIYTQLKMPFPVKNRDSCLLRVISAHNCNHNNNNIHNQDGSSNSNDEWSNVEYTVICKTTEHESCPIDKNGRQFVRTLTPLHAYLIIRDQSINGCHLFVLSTHDPMGSIPKFVINMVMSQSPVKWYSQLKSTAEMVKKKGWKPSSSGGKNRNALISILHPTPHSRL